MILAEDLHKLGHDAVVDTGSDPHFFLLLGRLDPANAVHNGRAVHIPAAAAQLLQPQEEPGGPVLVDGHGGIGVRKAAEDLHAVLNVVIIANLHPQILRLAEQVVDQQLISLPAQVQRQQPLTGLDPGAGEVENHRRIGNDHLGNAIGIHGVINRVQFQLVHKTCLRFVSLGFRLCYH